MWSGGQTLVVQDEAVQVTRDPAKGEVRRRLDVIPPVSLSFESAVELFSPGAVRTVEVDVVASRAEAAGSLRLEVPAGWSVSPGEAGIRAGRPGRAGGLRDIYRHRSP